jgi:hypothetical protein
MNEKVPGGTAGLIEIAEMALPLQVTLFICIKNPLIRDIELLRMLNHCTAFQKNFGAFIRQNYAIS